MKEVVLQFPVEANVNNHFAWARTLMGLQRTHMAAVRTAVTLIAFGFTVAEFLVRIGPSIPAPTGPLGPHEPRDMGLLLIAAGVVSLAAFTVQYRKAVVYLRSNTFATIAGEGRTAMTMPVYLISYTVMLIGVAAFLSVLVRL